MLAYCKELLEDQNWHMEVPSKYAKLVTCPLTAAERGDGTLDKEATSHDDCLMHSDYRLCSGIEK
jgi:hypothetical protein